jgi:Ni,Fe-hydrogenase maturation factor
LADIEIMDGGVGGIQLLDFFLRHDLVILVDATMDQLEPGHYNSINTALLKGLSENNHGA